MNIRIFLLPFCICVCVFNANWDKYTAFKDLINEDGFIDRTQVSGIGFAQLLVNTTAQSLYSDMSDKIDNCFAKYNVFTKWNPDKDDSNTLIMYLIFESRITNGLGTSSMAYLGDLLNGKDKFTLRQLMTKVTSNTFLASYLIFPLLL